MNLCLAIALLDIFSVLRGPFKEDEVRKNITLQGPAILVKTISDTH
jgi:hypothetical protein